MVGIATIVFFFVTIVIGVATILVDCDNCDQHAKSILGFFYCFVRGGGWLLFCPNRWQCSPMFLKMPSFWVKLGNHIYENNMHPLDRHHNMEAADKLLGCIWSSLWIYYGFRYLTNSLCRGVSNSLVLHIIGVTLLDFWRFIVKAASWVIRSTNQSVPG